MVHIEIISTGEQQIVIKVDGDLDFPSVPILRRTLDRYLKKNIYPLIIDLEGLKRIDQAGKALFKTYGNKVLLKNLSTFMQMELGVQNAK